VPEEELSAAVRAFARECGSRRAVAAALRVGTPGDDLVIPDQEWYDDALRADLVERALSCLDQPRPIAWLTRTGDCRLPQDADHAWCAATTAAALRIGTEVDFFVVTRKGWMELRTGRSRQWVRVRSAEPG